MEGLRTYKRSLWLAARTYLELSTLSSQLPMLLGFAWRGTLQHIIIHTPKNHMVGASVNNCTPSGTHESKMARLRGLGHQNAFDDGDGHFDDSRLCP